LGCQFPVRNLKLMTENCKLRKAIIRILQHFATKLWNITNFVMLFQAMMKFLSRSKFSLLRKCQLGKRNILWRYVKRI
jgi:valyl-tRNA synthetase